MNNDSKLQKLNLDSSWCDLSYGEPFLVREACFRQLNVMGSQFKIPGIESLRACEYQSAQGKQALISFLEKKHGAKVVITNGAKHGLAAVLHSLQKSGHTFIYYDAPYYPANPELVRNAGLTRTANLSTATAALLTSPNNPDGKTYTSMFMNSMMEDKYVIHDAAYHTPVYLPDGYTPDKVGHVQIFSLSKMYGFSGLRIGYVVCHDDALFKSIVDYVETTTAGVSTASQEIALAIEEYYYSNPERLRKFELDARAALKKNRELLTLLRPEIAFPTELISNSMFAWMNKGPQLDYIKAKVYMLDGSLFGAHDMVRLNIAVPYDTFKEAIWRLNSLI